MPGRNKLQSAEIDRIRKKAIKQFETAREQNLILENKLKDNVDDAYLTLCEIFEDLEKALPRDETEESISGPLRDTVMHFASSCYSLGGLLARRRSFDRLREMWMNGEISQAAFLTRIGRIKEGASRRYVAKAIELTDLAIGSGFSGKTVVGKAISAETKRQYRSTLFKRLNALKRKGPAVNIQ